MSYRDYEPVDLARAGFKIHQLESLEKDNIENAFAGYIDGVIGRINDGKEATVYLCNTANDTLLAAKVFKSKQFRHFSNDRNYRNVGKHRDRRMGRAMKKKSSKGQATFHKEWIESEWQFLSLLHDAGVNVPRPVAKSADGVLMEFIGDETGAAMRLINTELDRQALEHCATQLRADIETMLSLGIVHGDLSPYNILYWQKEPVIIDVPQAMHLHSTSNAWSMMQRDLANLDTWFRRLGLEPEFQRELGFG